MIRKHYLMILIADDPRSMTLEAAGMHSLRQLIEDGASFLRFYSA